MSFWEKLKKTVTPAIKKIGRWFTKREAVTGIREEAKPIEIMPRETIAEKPKPFTLGEIFKPVRELQITKPISGLEDIFKKAVPREPIKPELPEKKVVFKGVEEYAKPFEIPKAKIGRAPQTLDEYIASIGLPEAKITKYRGPVMKPVTAKERIEEMQRQTPKQDIVGGLKVFVRGLYNLPIQIASKVVMALQGSKGASVTERDRGDKLIKFAQEESDRFIKETAEKYRKDIFFPGIPIHEIAALPQNLAYSFVSMGTGLGVGVPISFIPLPGARAAAWTLGATASGVAAYNMTKYEITQEYLEIKNEEMLATQKREITPQEENQLKEGFEYLAMQHGLWEAVPEAVSNLAFAKILTMPLSKMLGKTWAGRITSKLTAVYGQELATETITEMGQMGVRGEAGLPGGRKINWANPQDWLQSLGAIAPQTFLLTTVMAGTGGVMVKSTEAIKKLKTEIGEDNPLYDKFKNAITGLKDMAEKAIEPLGEISIGLTIKEVGKPKVEKGIMTLYHGTTPEKATLIRKTGKIIASKDGDIYLTTNKENALSYGSEVFEVKIPQAKLSKVDFENVYGQGKLTASEKEMIEYAAEYNYIGKEIEIAEEITIYRGADKKFDFKAAEGRGTAFTTNFETAEGYAEIATKGEGGIVEEFTIDKNAKILRTVPAELKKYTAPGALIPANIDSILYNYGKKHGYDVIDERGFGELAEEEEIMIINLKVLKLKEIRPPTRPMVRAEAKREVKATQERIIAIIDKSALTLHDKAKFRKLIKNTQTFKQLESRKAEIQTRIEKLTEAETKRSLRSKIAKALVHVKVKKVAGKPVSKFTPEIQRVLTVIRDASKLNAEGIGNKITANLEQYQDKIPSDDIALENYLLSNWIMGLDTMTNPELQKLLNKITELKDTGRMADELQKFNRQADIEGWRNNAIFVITGGKGLPPGISTIGVRPEKLTTIKEKAQKFISGLGKEIVGWKDILDMLSAKDKTSKPGESRLNKFGDILDEKNAEKKGSRIAIQKVKQITKTSFEITKDRAMIKKFRQDSKEESLGVYRNAKDQNVELLFTKSEARKRWMELQDPTLEETFKVGMAYTEDMIQAIDRYLTPQDKAFARAQLKFYQEYYDSINKVYRDIYGVDLPHNLNYSPISREGVDRNISEGFGEFIQEIFIRRQVTSGSLKTRVRNIRPIKLQGDIAALEQHIVEMEHFKAWSKKMRDIDSVFGNSRIRTAIKINHGKGILSVLDGFLNDFTRGGTERAGRMKSLDKLRGRFARAVLAVKLSIGIKQLTSFIAFADAIPTKDFIIGTLDWTKNPIKKTKILLGSELMRERGKGLERDIKTAMKTDKWSNFRKRPSFLNSLMLNVQVGDKGAIVMGGWSVYRYYIKKGLTHEQAIKKFESITESTQQSADLSELSFWQRGGTFAKLFTMFRSSPNQYVRKEIGAVRNLIVGRQGVIKTAKTLLIFHFLLPMFFQWVSDAFEWDKKEQLRAAIFGPLNGLFILGDIIEGVVRTALGMKVYPHEIPIYGIANDIMKAVRELKADDIDTEDIMDAIRAIAGFTGSIAGVPLKATFDISTGVADVITGEFGQGFIKLLGWSPFVAEKKKEKEKKEDKLEHLFKPEPSKKEKRMEDIFKTEKAEDKLEYLFK